MAQETDFETVKENLINTIFSEESLKDLKIARDKIQEIQDTHDMSKGAILSKFYAAAFYVGCCDLNAHSPKIWHALTGQTMKDLFTEKGLFDQKDNPVINQIAHLEENGLFKDFDI